MRTVFAAVVCFFALLNYSKPLYAQSAIEVLDVTGSRLQENYLGSTSALTRADIEQINPISTLDLLRRLPHVSVAENAVGGASFVSIRGGESNFALILIDGIVVNDTTNSRGGGFDFSQINPRLIERVEVYRGGVSAIYGGEAISGAIHIFMREASANSVSLELGTQHQQNAQATMSTELSDNLQLTAGIASGQRKQSNIAQQENQQGLVKLSYRNQRIQHQLLMTYSQTDNIGLPEDSGGFLFAASKMPETRESEQWLVGMNNAFEMSDETSIHTSVSWMKHTEASDHPGIADGALSGIPASKISSSLKRLDANLYASHQFTKVTTVVAGVNHRDSTGENRGTLDFGFPLPVDYTLKQRVNSAFFEAQYTPLAFAFSLGWRIDNASGFDSESSKRAAASYAVNEKVRLFASYDQGYKLPSFFALAHPLVGNADLQPERSKNKELGVEIISEAYQFSASVFDNEFLDLVDFDPEQFTNINRNKVIAKGLELSLDTNVYDWLSIHSNISYSDVEAVEPTNNVGSKLRRRPKWAGSISVSAQWQKFNVVTMLDAKDRALDASIATGFSEIPGYAKVSVSANWEYSLSTVFSLNVDNLFAQQYQESVGFIYDEAIVRAGVTFTL